VQTGPAGSNCVDKVCTNDEVVSSQGPIVLGLYNGLANAEPLTLCAVQLHGAYCWQPALISETREDGLLGGKIFVQPDVDLIAGNRR
jgi:hypothetical protein